MKKILQFCLTILAKAYLRKYKSKIVAVTGNIGKTSTKEMIAAVLGSERKIRMSGGNLNNELGMPLAILGDYAEEYYKRGGTASFWLKVIVKSTLGFLGWRDRRSTRTGATSAPGREILVLEYGADHPGDIARLVKNFKPDVAVVTAIGEIPVHVEYFSGLEELAKEKSKLVEVLVSGDFAVLNSDDLAVLEMRQKTKAKIKTFGFAEDAGVRVSDFDFKVGANGEPEGVRFRLNNVQVEIKGSLGKSQAWSVAAAAAVGLIFGLDLAKISGALADYQGPAGRLRILKGIKNCWLIDDTYNASPSSTHLALETLKALSKTKKTHLETGFPSGRKIAVLGDMLELGKYSVQAHQEVGNFAGTFVDLLITVGSRAKFIADAAGNQMSKENILSFNISLEVKEKIKNLIREGDLVLVKGSQGMRMEKIVEEIMAEPEKKRELLVRQSERWLEK